MNETFSTRDLYLAATLMTLGFGIISVDYQVEGTRNMPVGYFNFEDSPEIKSAEQKYFQGSLAIEPRTFVTNLRGLKAQISNVYKGPRVDQSQFKRKETEK
jgi:hypothetical protein